MVDTPVTQYARSRGANLAYQVMGTGPTHLIYLPGMPTHCEQIWELGTQAPWRARLATFSRLIAFDQRGMGLSDPLAGDRGPTVDEEVDDIIAILAAAGCEQTAVLAAMFAGTVGVTLAVRRPDLVSRLVLHSTHARFLRAPDYPQGIDPHDASALIERVAAAWGTGITAGIVGFELATDERVRADFGRYERMCLSPGRTRPLFRAWIERDVRALLPQVEVPTLVVHHSQASMSPLPMGQYLAERIPRAQYLEEAGNGFLVTGPLLDFAMSRLSEFVTGSRAAAVVDRELAVLLFVDVARSTEHVAALGDTAWHGRLEDFRRVVRAEIERHGGREVNTRGDDILVCFSSPTRAVTCAQSIRCRVHGLDLRIRAAMHLGEIESQGSDVVGLAVHIGARVAEKAQADEILVSQTVRDALLGAGVALSDRGTHALRGVPGEWRLYAVSESW